MQPDGLPHPADTRAPQASRLRPVAAEDRVARARAQWAADSDAGHLGASSRAAEERAHAGFVRMRAVSPPHGAPLPSPPALRPEVDEPCEPPSRVPTDPADIATLLQLAPAAPLSPPDARLVFEAPAVPALEPLCTSPVELPPDRHAEALVAAPETPRRLEPPEPPAVAPAVTPAVAAAAAALLAMAPERQGVQQPHSPTGAAAALRQHGLALAPQLTVVAHISHDSLDVGLLLPTAPRPAAASPVAAALLLARGAAAALLEPTRIGTALITRLCWNPTAALPPQAVAAGRTACAEPAQLPHGTAREAQPSWDLDRVAPFPQRPTDAFETSAPPPAPPQRPAAPPPQPMQHMAVPIHRASGEVRHAVVQRAAVDLDEFIRASNPALFGTSPPPQHRAARSVPCSLGVAKDAELLTALEVEHGAPPSPLSQAVTHRLGRRDAVPVPARRNVRRRPPG